MREGGAGGERVEPGRQTPAGEPAEPAEAAREAEPEHRCDLCGAPMLEWHCRIICTFCGYQRDCSDP
jgi:hypothetical protein